MKKNEIILSFGIYDFEDITHDDITKLLSIEPSHIRIKGYPKNPKNIEGPVITNNSWRISSGLDEYADFDAQLNAILNIIEPKIDLFRPLCEKYTCELSCAIYIYFENGQSTPWVHLDSRYNKLIKELNIEFDIDLYVLYDK
jgi:hypothetical protein